MPNFEELLVSRVGHSFFGLNRFQSELETDSSVQERRTNFETKLLEVRHVSRLKFFHLGLLNSILKQVFMNVCGLPLRGLSHRSFLALSVGISVYDCMKNDGPTSILQHNFQQFRSLEPYENVGAIEA